MVQATTPTFILTLPNDIDLGEAAHVYFTMRQNGSVIEKSDSDLTINANEVDVYLSQEETLKLSLGAARLQLNWTYANGSRACSTIATVNVDENLLKAVVE